MKSGGKTRGRSRSPAAWQQEFGSSLRSLKSLAARLPDHAWDLSALRPVQERYPVAITPYYAALIEKPDPADPIFRQCAPALEELENSPGLSPDPLAEEKYSPVEGLVHRYPDRVLLLLTNLCFVNCRHCLRKRIWGRKLKRPLRSRFLRMRDYLAANPSVREAILSGGDPLTLTNSELEFILASLRAIPSLEVIRIHTRAPVTLPSRIEPGLLSLLDRFGPIWLNTQFNHPREITPAAAAAIEGLLRAGVPVGNQAVLLKGINDTLEVQRELCLGLLRIKVRPYYLFHCDPAEGVGHFQTSVKCGRAIISELCRNLSGLAIPTYALELPEGGGKVRINPV